MDEQVEFFNEKYNEYLIAEFRANFKSKKNFIATVTGGYLFEQGDGFEFRRSD